MSDPDPLDAIKERWFTEERHMPEHWHDLAQRDIPWLIGEVEQLRKALDEIDNLASGAIRFGREVRK